VSASSCSGDDGFEIPLPEEVLTFAESLNPTFSTSFHPCRFWNLCTKTVHINLAKLALFSSKECKTNTLPILMHQMRISTTQVSSVMLRSKKLESQKQM
jgi:hypothetical protein